MLLSSTREDPIANQDSMERMIAEIKTATIYLLCNCAVQF